VGPPRALKWAASAARVFAHGPVPPP